MTTFKKISKIIAISLLILLILITIFTAIYVLNINKNLDYNKNMLIEANSKVEIFDDNNNLFSNYNNAESLVKLEELPSYVSASFISIEDKNFYSHKGINYKRMAKALLNNIKSLSAKEGASTISQQLIKNTYLSSEKTVERKIKEILLTKKMEKQFTKEQILETYLNIIYFGNNSYGIEQASKNYFNKKAKDLTISESAMLAGMIKSPKLYSPIYNKERCLKRRNLVLKEMLNDSKITNEQYDNAVKEEIVINSNNSNFKNFYEQASLQEASKILNISEKEIATKGYKIFTYLNLDDQRTLKNALLNKDYYHKNKYGNIADSAGIIIDNSNGGITAFTGKSVYDIVNMKRMPGSTIKPIMVYAKALEDGKISPETPILDEETDFSGYKPHNVANKYYGWISARKTIEKSLNVPAIKIMQYTGIDKCKKMAESCGITFDKQDNNYSIALGAITNGLTVKQTVNSFLPLSGDGNFINASFIRKICDKNGNLLYENNCTKTKVMSEETAYLLTDMLKSSTKYGTSSRLKDIEYEIAGKTGTVGIKNTNFNSDVWSVAYTKSKTCGVWLGNSTNKEEYKLEGCNNGGTFATSIVKEVFNNLNLDKRNEKFNRPEGVEEIDIDLLELNNNHIIKLVDENYPEIFKEKILVNKKYKPTEVGNNFSELSVVKLNVSLNKSKPKISFNALPQCEYSIYRIEEDKTILLKTIKNEKGEIEYLDNSTDLDTQYEYYVKATIKNYAKNKDIKTIKSNSVKVFTPSLINKTNEQIINRNYAFA